MKVIENPNIELWEDIVDNCEYATFFHTPTWAKILEETYPHYRIATKLFIFNDGTRVILPLMKSRWHKRVSHSYTSMPFGLYGGIASDSEVDDQKNEEIFRYISKLNVFINVEIVGNPYNNYELPDKYQTRDYFTQILTLEKGFEAIWNDYKHSVRKQIKKAERNGVYVKLADNLEEYEEYFRIYQMALERWGKEAKSGYEFVLFENMHKLGRANVRLWLVYCRDGKMVGGTLAFYHNWHSVEWHAAFDSDYFKFGTRNFLVNEIIKDAIQNRYRVYDFNPSGGHEGVVEFKKSFGAQKRTFKLWHFRSPVYQRLSKLRSLLPS